MTRIHATRGHATSTIPGLPTSCPAARRRDLGRTPSSAIQNPKSKIKNPAAWVARATLLALLPCAAALAAAPAPPFHLQDTHGRPVALDGYRGAVVLLTFGPSW
jgi:hypothetical protein